MNPGASGPCSPTLTGDPLADLLPDSTTGECADVYYPPTKSFPGGSWDPSTYTIALTIFANGSIGNLSDGFFAPEVLGLPAGSNFTCATYQGNPPTVPLDAPFCDGFATGVERDGHWALDIYNVDSASVVDAVPEPGTSALTLAGLALGLLRIRKRA